MSGVTTDRYRIVSKLGQGGMGEVYLAEDMELGRKVALKFMHTGAETDAVARARFRHEAKAAAAIDHPFICKVYEVGEADGRLFIAMEYLEGQTLQACLASRKPLAWPEARRIILEISEALIKAHQTGIIHRDLKPANVMEAADGHVKVLDFGLAKRVLDVGSDTPSSGGVTEWGKIVGTIHYMSPEQLRGLTADVRSDIFSLGVMFYELVTGRHPFARASPIETAGAIFHDTPEPVSHLNGELPPELDSIVSRMLEKEPVHRYQTIREFLDDLACGSDTGDLTPVLTRARATAASSIAVLPFVNMSKEPEQEYFSDGITEELIAEISRIRGLTVIARTSVMQLKNTQKDLAVIGRELGVRMVLEGSVRRAAQRVRITCGLVDTQTRQQIWMEVFDRELTDIFAIQTEVAKQVAATLSKSLSQSSMDTSLIIPPKSAEAYHVYLRARFLMNKATPDAIQKAIACFQQAIAMDPDNARAYAGLSNCYAVAGHWDFIPPQEAAANARAAAQQAIALDRRLPEAYTSLGMALLQEWDWAACDRSFCRAIDLNPNSVDARVFYSWYLCLAGRIDEALIHAGRAVEVDPLSSFVGAIFSWLLIIAGRFDEAVQRLESILDIDPGFTMAYAELGHAYVGKGMYDEALVLIEKGAWRKALYLITLAIAGRFDETSRRLEALIESGDAECERPSEIAYIYLLLGQPDKAAMWLSRAFAARDYMIVMHVSPNWAPCKRDPLVLDYLQRLGLSQ